jgi:hypothetical protein
VAHLAPLRVPGFARLLGSYTVNELGDAIAVIALAVLVFDRTGDPLATMALFLAAKFLPALASPLLTARVDQAPLRASLTAIYLCEGAIFALLAIVATHFSMVLVLVLALLDGTLALVARSLTRGAAATLLAPSGLLRDGNALLNIGFGVASVAGLAAGGLIVATASIQAALVIDGVSFVLVALALATARELPRPAQDGTAYLARLGDGLRHVARRPVIRRLLAWQALALVCFTLVVPIEVVYVKETLGSDDLGLGVLMATWSAGILAGGLLFVRLKRWPAGRLVVGSTAAIGVAYTGMGLSRTLALACAFSVVGGVGNGIQWVSVMSLLQEATPLKLQARVAGLLESLAAGMPGLGFVLGGALTAIASPAVAYTAAGVATLLLVAVAAVTRPPVSVASDLDHDGQHHRPALQPVVDE